MAVVLGLAGLGGVMAKIAKQPAILGYIAAGLLISASGWGRGMQGLLGAMGQIGVTLLLFLVGLELPITDLKRLGKVSVTSGVVQIGLMAILGFGLARLLGFTTMPAIYLGVALTFSSTIMAIRLLSEKGDLQSLHGKLAVGSLLVQDFVAMGILVGLAGLTNGKVDSFSVAMMLVRGTVGIGVIMGLSRLAIPKALEWLSTSTELLFIASIGWCMAVAAIISSPLVGLSVQMGGLVAGLALAGAAQQVQITARVKPLRDFFVTLFFVSLGAGVQMSHLGLWLVPAGVFSLYVVLGNPLVMMTVLGLFGYKKRTAFLAAIPMGQISEFSLVVVAAAAASGIVGPEILVIVTLVAMITMTTSAYIVGHAEKVYRMIWRYIPYYQSRRKAEETTLDEGLEGHIVLFGHNRIGSEIRPILQKLGRPVVVVDFNPEIVERLIQEGVATVYGDVADVEIYDDLRLGKADLVISTVPDKTDNMVLLKTLKGGKQVIVVTAADKQDAAELYKAGADYVLVPHSVGGAYLSQILKQHGLDSKFWRQVGDEK